MPGKLEGEILNICRRIPSRGVPRPDEAAEGKGISASSFFPPPCCFSVREAARGEAGSLKDLFAQAHTPHHFSLREPGQELRREGGGGEVQIYRKCFTEL